MSFQPDNDLQRAMAALTIQQVWQRCGLPDAPREGNHCVKSPFREDRNKSFSIFAKGAAFKDQATGDKGGVWKFVAMAKPGLVKKEIADLLIEWSGIARTSRAPLPPAGGPVSVLGSPSETKADGSVDPYVLKAAKRLKKLDEVRAAEDRLVEQRLKALGPSVQARTIGLWSVVVEERWRASSSYAAGAAQELATARGWPVNWVAWLLDSDLLSWPVLPWSDAGSSGPAFRVDMPEFGAVDNHQEIVGLQPVGYHQRFTINGEKSWVYVPYMPAEEKVRTDFQRTMVEEEAQRGGVVGETVIPGLPFFMGCLRGVRFLVIAEGQWDAVTFAGAAGWLECESAWPEGAAVMGVRGANGFDTMLAYWREWLAWERPAVLVLADNDKAGRKWSEAEEVPLGQAAPPTFTEKLLHAGGRRVEVHRVRKDFGKDFNDYYKARKPTAEALARWLQVLGFAGPGGWL